MATLVGLSVTDSPLLIICLYDAKERRQATRSDTKMIKGIVVKQKSVYGEDKIYPVCEHAQMLAELAGTKTFTPRAIKLIKNMGIDILLEELKPAHRYI
jgi:hypothetical protein|tara:strand:+ start:277 stop:573 length:297 start_codon:yes stop_codon:yes gene_type:complete